MAMEPTSETIEREARSREKGGSGRSTSTPGGNNRDGGGDKLNKPEASKPKGSLIPLADGTFLTPDGLVVTGVEAKALGFKVPETRAQLAARSPLAIQERQRLGSSQTILTSPGVGLGASTIRRPSLSGG